MLIKILTMIILLVILLGLTGLPVGISEILFSLFMLSSSYLFARKFNLIPRKIYLNYHCLLYFVWLIKEIFISSLAVMRIIWRRNLNINPVFEWIHSEQQNEVGLVIYANSITLTPGTVTINIANNMLLIHALEQQSIDNLKHNNLSMSKKVQKILGKTKD